MGKGIAFEFKQRFPAMFADYVARCARGEVRPGVPYLYRGLVPPQIVNFPTKDHWKSASRIEDIQRGLDYLAAHCGAWGITSLAVPPLGCGSGHLTWKEVGPLIYNWARQLPMSVEVYAPYGVNPQELTLAFLAGDTAAANAPHGARVPSVRPAWIALIEIVNRIENQPYHWPVGRTIFQKIAYVATRMGLPTGFTYDKGSFGPFSTQLKAAQAALTNNNLLREERSGRMFMVKTGSAFQHARQSVAPQLRQWSAIIDKTTDLFMRVNTDQAEILTTVMYSTDELAKACGQEPSEMDVLEAVMKWKQRRQPPIEARQVQSTICNLGMLGWLNIVPDAKPALAIDDVDLDQA
jgi:uncharacterized protein YwgA